jgi:DNA-binding NtrC family response regulator
MLPGQELPGAVQERTILCQILESRNDWPRGPSSIAMTTAAIHDSAPQSSKRKTGGCCDDHALKVLVVDDDPAERSVLLEQVSELGYRCGEAKNAFEALMHLASEIWDVVITDLHMPVMDGMELLRRIKREHADVEVVLTTAHGSIKAAVAALQEGAADFLSKPVQPEEVAIRLQKLSEIRGMRRELLLLRDCLGESGACCGLIGVSPLIREVYQRIQAFAPSTVPVLITGRTGTGKEVVARALHLRGLRPQGPFVAVACGAIPTTLAESELFGHEKGAFTGAVQLRRGSFERADRGTILLDDVDDLPLEIQAKLLRVLQEGTIQRVGAEREISVDVRVMATTNIDLEAAVSQKRFREDLFYRLRGLEVSLPPLKDRGADVLLIAQSFLKTLADRDKGPPKILSGEAAQALLSYGWPGNVRELRRVIEVASVLCSAGEIQTGHLPHYLRQAPLQKAPAGDLFSLHLEHCDSVWFNELLMQFETKLIEWAMSRANHNQSQAAQFLHLPRTTFQSKLPVPHNNVSAASV